MIFAIANSHTHARTRKKNTEQLRLLTTTPTICHGNLVGILVELKELSEEEEKEEEEKVLAILFFNEVICINTTTHAQTE